MRRVPHLQQVEHRVPMLSIDNTYSVEELQKYGERIDKLLDGEAIEWVGGTEKLTGSRFLCCMNAGNLCAA